MENKADLKRMYRDIKKPYALGDSHGISSLLHVLVHTVQKWIRSQTTEQWHKPVRKKFKRNSYSARGLHFCWQIDLCDLSRLKAHNNRICYLLGAVDVFSRQAFVRGMTRRSGPVVAKHIRSIFEEDERKIPRQIYSDKGTEFTGKEFQKVMQEYGVYHYTVTNVIRKAYIVERMWRSLLNLIYKYMTEFDTKRYIDVLPQLVAVYNNRYHRSIGMAPNKVTMVNQHLITVKTTQKILPKYLIGSYVRLAIPKTVFQKGYMRTFTREVFVIDSIYEKRQVPMYRVRDMNGNMISGAYYEAELQVI